MGFKEARARAKENVQFQAMFEGYSIMNGLLSGPMGVLGDRYPLGGIVAEVDTSDSRERSTLTRIAAGAIVAGPVGAIVGGMLKKQRGRGYLAMYIPAGETILVDFNPKDATKARAFAIKLNAAGSWYAEHSFGDGSIS